MVVESMAVMGDLNGIACFDYGCGLFEKKSLNELCMVEFGRGKKLFSPESLKKMRLSPGGLYVVCTMAGGCMEVHEVSGDVSIRFVPE